MNPDSNELFAAVRNNNYKLAECLLRQLETADVRDIFSGITPLHSAAANGDCRMIDLLVRYGANLNATSNDTLSSPLGTAASAGHVEAVRMLINLGGKLSAGEESIVDEAIVAGDGEIAELLRCSLRSE